VSHRVDTADGAIGSLLQGGNCPLEKDFRGVEGCKEILNDTRPDVLADIHGDLLRHRHRRPVSQSSPSKTPRSFPIAIHFPLGAFSLRAPPACPPTGRTTLIAKAINAFEEEQWKQLRSLLSLPAATVRESFSDYWGNHVRRIIRLRTGTGKTEKNAGTLYQACCFGVHLPFDHGLRPDGGFPV